MSAWQRIAEYTLLACGVAFLIFAAMYPITALLWLAVSFVVCAGLGKLLARAQS